jgi:hypothetical protein
LLAVERGLDGEITTLAFLDLDGFKHYNDSFGHLRRVRRDGLRPQLPSAEVARAGARGARPRGGHAVRPEVVEALHRHVSAERLHARVHAIRQLP